MLISSCRVSHAACVCVIASLVLLAKSANAALHAQQERKEFLSPIAANAKKMGMPESVIECLDKELARFQRYPDMKSITPEERKIRYANFVNVILAPCVGTTKRTAPAVAADDALRIAKHSKSLDSSAVVERTKSKDKNKPKPTAPEGWEGQPSEIPGKPTGPYKDEYCGACDSGCHYCCVNQGTPGFGYCWYVAWCGGNGKCD